MTSVTLASTSGPLHGGYPSVTQEAPSSELDCETPRPVKRCLVAPPADPCKKRRKQSTPIRISSAELESNSTPAEGKPVTSDLEVDLQCPVCQFYFDAPDQLQTHILSDHPPLVCKKEPEDFPSTSTPVDRTEIPLELTTPKPEVQWMNDFQKKEWMNNALSTIPYNPTNQVFMALPQFAQPENMPRQPIRIFNPDAYCDLCNKEFCNKYFLKTHKANKHGIYTDTPSSIEQLPNPSFPGSVRLSTSVPSELSSVKIEHKPPANMINQFSDMFPNPFSNKLFTKINKSHIPSLFENESNENVPSSNGFSSNSESDKVLSDDQPAEESSSPNNPQTETTSYPQDSEGMYYVPPSKLSPGQQSRELDLSNRLRRIGVMNPKAFCEICCKEYCNKYFLRTHKMKRHGIYIPDDREKDIKLEGFANLHWQHNIQTSPLNLIMTEQSHSDRKTTSPNDISCDICGIKFQNISLAQLHNVSVHGKVSSRELENSEDDSKKVNANEKSLNAEAISEDLQKLQTMILQLNDIDASKTSTTCSACNKEFENRYYLHGHMITEHGMLLEDVTDIEKHGEGENSSNNNTLCDLCGKDLQNADDMKKHIIEFHSGGENSKEEFGVFGTPEKGVINKLNTSSGQLAERRTSMNVTPTSSYCDICNKELCNKYFMKTHMQRMHGIEIENGAQIGGVICDICNKELCSKYFLRVHKHNTHGIVEYGTSLLQPRKSEGEPQTPTLPSEPDPALKPTDLADLSHRYFTHFTEVCTICSRRFRSTKWLKSHLLSDHGQAGAEKWAELEQQLQYTMNQTPKTTKSERSSPPLKIPNGNQENHPKVGIHNVLSSIFGVDESSSKNYQCTFCPFTTPLLPLLFVHERSHTVNAANGECVPLKCPVCPQSFLQPELLQHHMFTQHPFLPLPPFFNGSSESQGEVVKVEEEEEDNKDKERSTNTSPDPGSSKLGCKNGKKVKSKLRKSELSPEAGQSLKDVAKRAQLPATYALPQGQGQLDQEASDGSLRTTPGYVMQAFLLEESAPDRRVVPAVVFLPVLQKQPAPFTVTFTLTPA